MSYPFHTEPAVTPTFFPFTRETKERLVRSTIDSDPAFAIRQHHMLLNRDNGIMARIIFDTELLMLHEGAVSTQTHTRGALFTYAILNAEGPLQPLPVMSPDAARTLQDRHIFMGAPMPEDDGPADPNVLNILEDVYKPYLEAEPDMSELLERRSYRTGNPRFYLLGGAATVACLRVAALDEGREPPSQPV